MGGAVKRGKKPKPPPSLYPHDCAVLAVDTAQVSGWAVYVSGRLMASGEINMLTGGLSVRGACGSAIQSHRHAVLVFERPFRGTTQGQWIGAWKTAWVEAGGRKVAMLGVYPATWRARVLGASRLPRNEVRKIEMGYATRIADRKCGPDEAAAVCIGRWAIHAGEVGLKLPKKRVPKAA